MATKNATKTAAKNPARKAAKSAAKRPAKKSSATGLTVRMYRQGLGDCFLITFPKDDGTPFRLMIDCGVVLGTPDPTTEMTKVLNNVLETTKELDLLVATHEHWDHVSGFVQVPDLFDQIDIRHVWLAWTEDPKDKLAAQLRAERRTAENALRMASSHLAVNGMGETSARVQSMVDFFGAKSSGGTTTDALNYVKKRAGKNVTYHLPGEEPILLDGLSGYRFYVLGPPHDAKLIKKSNPGKNDAYGLDAGPDGSQAFLVQAFTRGMGAADSSASPEDPIEDPFDRNYSIPFDAAKLDPFFDRHFFGEVADGSVLEKVSASKLNLGRARKSAPAEEEEPEYQLAEARNQQWRRIDNFWMGGAETMALQLDSATNNTSLVIAIEIVKTGEVLLFPGDAQAGNWLSWQSLEWELEEKGKKKKVTGPDLLARTIFYKVGHHGSHNATLKDKGLELMTSEDLVAMIPVNHKMAEKKGWGRMPLPDLVTRLHERTHGRTLQIDDKTSTAADLAKLKPKNAEDAKLWDVFAARVTVDELYYELEF